MDIAAELRALADKIEGTVTVSPGEPPEGFVAVRPTGPQGAGKVRFWPKPFRVEGQRPQDGEMSMAYAIRCQNTLSPQTGQPCLNGGRNIPNVPGFNPYHTVDGLAEMLDRYVYSQDWADQAELDRQAELAERDRINGAHFSGG